MPRTLELLDRLIAFPTISSTSNLALIDWAQGLLSGAGFSVTRIPSPTGEKAGIFARIGPEVAGGICLSAHTDVVPVEGQDWTREPFNLSQDAGRVFGRGVTDMKGFVASALGLAERAKHSDLKQPLSLVLSYDEEVGCTGIRDMLPALRPLIGQPQLVIVGEPTSMQVAIGHRGKVALQVTCRGEAGHSAQAPDFINAVHVAADFIRETRAVQNTLAKGPQDPGYAIPYPTVHIGQMSGGRALNIVPDQAQIDMEFRHGAETPAQDILGAIRAAAERAQGAFGRTDLIRIAEVSAYPGLDQDGNAKHVALAGQLSGNKGVIKVPFGTEAGHLATLGLSTVVVGPGDITRDGHKPDEGLDIAQLAECDGMMERVLALLTQDPRG